MKLNSKVAIYIPSTINVNQTVNNSEQVKKACVFLSGLFGGCTAVNGSGCWVSDTTGLVTEDVKIIYSFCSRLQLMKSKKSIFNYCRELCREMSQEAISLEINNQLYFVN